MLRVLACGLAALASACPSWAATLSVTNTSDSGSGSLRDAIAKAVSGDTINFNVPLPATITLSTTLSICNGQTLTISGPGASNLAINGNLEVQVFSICSGTNVTISGITVTHGFAANDGGGISNGGTLTLTNIAVSGNRALNHGAGIVNGGTLTLTNSGLSQNEADSTGGGIFNAGTLTITGSTLSGNSCGGAEGFGGGAGIDNFGTLTMTSSTLSGGAASEGGGIENEGELTMINSTVSGNGSLIDAGGIFNAGTLTMTNSTVSNNGTSGEGGGILNFNTLTITSSTLSNNGSEGEGGGISNETAGALTMINSTLSGNSSESDRGGGIFNAGTLSMTNSTFWENSSEVGGGFFSVGAFTLKSTLLASNSGGNCGGGVPVTSAGYNLSDDATCANAFTQPGDKNNTPAELAPTGLQNNGGPTLTVALLPGSPALDAIPVADCIDLQGNRVGADQRGVGRPQGSGCDIGAFELAENTPFSYFNVKLAVLTGKPSGFALTAVLTLGSASNGIHPLTEAVTLQIADYAVTIPAGSFHQLWNSPQAPYAYEGAINGTKLVVGLIVLGGNSYQFDAAGSPVVWNGIKNPVTVSLTIGNDADSVPVTALISTH